MRRGISSQLRIEEQRREELEGERLILKEEIGKLEQEINNLYFRITEIDAEVKVLKAKTNKILSDAKREKDRNAEIKGMKEEIIKKQETLAYKKQYLDIFYREDPF